MKKFLEEVKTDLSFIRSHTLQPTGYKVFKVVVLVAGAVLYLVQFGAAKTIAFFGIFFSMCLFVHMVYRVKTDTWQRTWLDFIVTEENGEIKPDRIGVYYYSAVLFNALVALGVSQIFF